MNEKRVVKLPHHVQQKLCQTRPPYRQGKKLTSVKVYTVNDESKHLMICGVPKLQLGEEIEKLVSPYGDVKRIHAVSDYPSEEEFTEAYYVQYARIQSARIAKRFIDGKNFYGGSLHIFYVPELESVTETKAKLAQRRRDIAVRIKRNQQDARNPNTDKFIIKEQYHRKKKAPALPLTEDRLAQHYPGETLSSIYHGIPQSIDPRTVSEPSLPSTSYSRQENDSVVPSTSQAPYSPNEAVLRASKVNETSSNPAFTRNKRKNYKGQSIGRNVKVRIVRPRIVDTSTIVKWDASEKNVFTGSKKSQNNIKIKLIPKSDNDKKRIVIKDQSVSQLVKPSEDLQVSIQKIKSQVRAAMQVTKKGDVDEATLCRGLSRIQGIKLPRIAIGINID